MDGLEPEDLLILGVGLIVVLNRVFTGTSLKLRRWAYVGLQVVNLATMGALLRLALPGYPPKLEAAVRVFLMFFVVWHMVLASQGRARALREVVEDGKREERRDHEREHRLEQLARWDEEVDRRGGPEEVDRRGGPEGS